MRNSLLNIFLTMLIVFGVAPFSLAQTRRDAATSQIASEDQARSVSTKSGLGQSSTEKAANEIITVEALQSKIKQIADQQDIDEAQKAKLRDTLQQAVQELEASKTTAAVISLYDKTIASAPDDLKEIKAKLATLAELKPEEPPANCSLTQISQLIAKKQGELDSFRAELIKIDAEPNRRSVRRLEIQKLSSDARDRLANLDASAQKGSPDEDNPAFTAARRALFFVQRRSIELEIQSNEKELLAYGATTELWPLRRDLIARQLANCEKELKSLQEAANAQRQREAEKQVLQARQDAMSSQPVARKMAKDKAELAEKRKALAVRIAKTTRELDVAKANLAKLQDEFAQTKKKVEMVGKANVVGTMLRQKRNYFLPSLREEALHAESRQEAIGKCQFDSLEFDELRSKLADLDAQVAVEMSKQDASLDEEETQAIKKAVREALETKRDYLDGVRDDNATLFNNLIELDCAEKRLNIKIEEYSRFIDERILWIASTEPLNVSDAKSAGGALAWLFGPQSFYELAGELLSDVGRNKTLYALAAVAFVGLSFARRLLRSRISKIGSFARSDEESRVWPAFEALLLTGLIAAYWPALMWFVAWRLQLISRPQEYCYCLGCGFSYAAKIYLAIEWLRAACRANGLAESHLGWASETLRQLRFHVKWLTVALLPLSVVVIAVSEKENEAWNVSLGRVCFIGTMLFFALFVQRVTRPNGCVFRDFLATRQGGWIDRLKYVWHAAAVFVPTALACLAAAGYYYTSQQLALRMVISVYLLLGIILIRAFLLQWVRLARRQLAIAHARFRKLAGPIGAPTTSKQVIDEDAERSLAAINVQTRHLVEYSLTMASVLAVWLIWIDVLPALGVFNRIELYPTTVSVTEVVPVADIVSGGNQAAGVEKSGLMRTEDKIRWVTLGNLVAAALMLFMTLIAAKNVPGLLEMALLQRLPVDSGARYAAAAISRYLITIVGMLVFCNLLGFGWSKVQWLVAAISVGLGFGLQEIFANFVSGLIILFERPIRVGDVITIGGVSGVVSCVRMRATTIVDWDRKELIVPNKDLIAGRVLNWTLSDQVNRVEIKVGVAYGSDTELAASLLDEIARRHAMVLRDPAPVVALEGFGDSALNFVLRCYLPSLEKRMQVVHELHMTIDRSFRKHGIEIAFPQQDIHVRSISAEAGAKEAVFGAEKSTKRGAA